MLDLENVVLSQGNSSRLRVVSGLLEYGASRVHNQLITSYQNTWIYYRSSDKAVYLDHVLISYLNFIWKPSSLSELTPY